LLSLQFLGIDLALGSKGNMNALVIQMEAQTVDFTCVGVLARRQARTAGNPIAKTATSQSVAC
jgi:hypothetical protein